MSTSDETTNDPKLANSESSQGLNPDRHYSVLLGGSDGANGNIKIKVGCGSGADVFIGQVVGSLIQELAEDGSFDLVNRGPLFVDCSEHGRYIGLFQMLQAGPADKAGSHPVQLPLLLFAMSDGETVLPLG